MGNYSLDEVQALVELYEELRVGQEIKSLQLAHRGSTIPEDYDTDPGYEWVSIKRKSNGQRRRVTVKVPRKQIVSVALTPNTLVLCADLQKGLRVLKRNYLKLYTAVLLVGLLGLTVREAASVADGSKDTWGRRYQQGLEILTELMNKGA